MGKFGEHGWCDICGKEMVALFTSTVCSGEDNHEEFLKVKYTDGLDNKVAKIIHYNRPKPTLSGAFKKVKDSELLALEQEVKDVLEHQAQIFADKYWAGK